MIKRCHDPVEVSDALELYPFGDVHLDAAEWLEDKNNIAFSDPRGNVGMFGMFYPKVYTGHYFFKDRGKAARDLAVEMLRKAFEEYEIEVVRGLTPTEHKAAVWMSKHLGFTAVEEVDTVLGPCVLFMMTKAEFFSRHPRNENG